MPDKFASLELRVVQNIMNMIHDKLVGEVYHFEMISLSWIFLTLKKHRANIDGCCYWSSHFVGNVC